MYKQNCMLNKLKLNSTIAIAMLFILFTGSVFGQSKFELTSDWKLIESTKDVNFYVKRAECKIEGLEKPLVYTFMKVENLSTTEKNLRYNFGLQYFEGCTGCAEGYEFYYSLTVPAKSTIEGDCSFSVKELVRLIYNPNLAGGWKFEQPVIKNLIVE